MPHTSFLPEINCSGITVINESLYDGYDKCAGDTDITGTCALLVSIIYALNNDVGFFEIEFPFWNIF